MRSERIGAENIRTSGSLYRGMVESGIPKSVAGHLHDHEKAHASADPEGHGEFGFFVTGGFIVAYYLIKGERTPEQLMEIASAPGFAEMSSKDWEIYKNAWRKWLKEAEEERREKVYEEEGIAGLKRKLIKTLSGNLDGYIKRDEFPTLPEILDSDFTELVKENGSLIRQAYEDAIEEVKKEVVEETLPEK